ncbi:MAG: hypothetical protein E7266_06585 [Lachnospiraceae bacterium]|nr:hypothetical protein [Lachnospiraceae bacterium]
MENSLKGLMLAAGTIITCIIVTLGFYIAGEAKNTATGSANQINKLNVEFMENDKVIYDGATVSGTEVVNVIKKMQSEKIGVYVENGTTNTYYGYNFNLTTGELGSKTANVYTAAIDEGTGTYINPYGSFKGVVIRNSNNIITGIIFK